MKIPQVTVDDVCVCVCVCVCGSHRLWMLVAVDVSLGQRQIPGLDYPVGTWWAPSTCPSINFSTRRQRPFLANRPSKQVSVWYLCVCLCVVCCWQGSQAVFVHGAASAQVADADCFVI